MVTVMLPVRVTAQEVNFSLGADIVSSYVWRGMKTAPASVQPSATLEIGGFSLGAWGSTDITGDGTKEVDFTAAYSIAGFTVAITDYWWAGEDEFRYFHYDAHDTEHLFEATIGYKLPVESFPLSLTWNTMFAGDDYNKADGKRAYSTYVELEYPFSIKEVDLGLQIGFTPWESRLYTSHTDKFSVINVGLKAAKTVKITESFSLPIFTHLIFNPEAEDIHFVFGISL